MSFLHTHKKVSYLFFISTVLLLAVMNVQAAEWTFMVYLDADNNLESAGIEDFLEISSIGSDANVNFVVLFDRTLGYDSSLGNWTGTRQGLVQFGDVPDLSWGQDMGELNMGNPQTLTDFMTWSRQNYPANHYAVILWNHGGGWRTEEEILSKPPYKAVCWDDDNGGDSLEMREVREAFESVISTQGTALIGFDACIMAMVEVAYEIRNHSKVMVASAANEPGDGWPYERICADLTENPTMDAQTLGTMIVDNYYLSYGNDETQAAFDLTLMDDLAMNLDNLAVTLSSDFITDPPACVAAAQGMKTALDNTIIHALLGTSWRDGHGLSIYFPSSSIDSDYNESVIQLPNDTNWDEFLYDYQHNMIGTWIQDARNATQSYDTTALDIYDFCENLIASIPSLTVSPNDDVVIQGDPGGPFEPNSAFYQMLNTGNKAINWQVSATVGWLDVSPSSGTLTDGESVMVGVSANANAETLPEGVYTDTLEFVNLSSTTTVATHQVSLLVGTVDYFTENFTSNDFDLDGMSLTFTPNGNGGYTACTGTITAFNTDPKGGIRLIIGDDEYANVSLSNAVSLYGTAYTNLYVGSNGYITFTEGDDTYQISETNHFDLPRIAPLYCDLSPNRDCIISYKEFSGGVAVTYERVPQYDTTNSNTFQVEMFTNGTIALSWLGIDTSNALVGLSGGTQPEVFFESDLSAYEPCFGQEPVEILVFVGFTGGPSDPEVHNTLIALNEQFINDNITILNRPNPALLANMLTNTDVLLIPEQQRATTVDMQRLGEAWSGILNDFISTGGVIVMTDHCISADDSANAFMNSAGLCEIGAGSILSSPGNEQDVQVVSTSDPLVKGVSATFTAKLGAKSYASVTGGNAVVVDMSGDPVVISCDYAGCSGQTVLMGWDFHSYNEDMAKILANAIKLGQD